MKFKIYKDKGSNAYSRHTGVLHIKLDRDLLPRFYALKEQYNVTGVFLVNQMIRHCIEDLEEAKEKLNPPEETL